MDELKECPFCGKQPNVQENFPYNRLCTISCENKKCKVHPYRVDFCFKKAAKNWNLRIQPENKPEKQIPKKPSKIWRSTFEQYEPSYAVCQCGKKIKIGDVYCSECGQKLDWSENDG